MVCTLEYKFRVTFYTELYIQPVWYEIYLNIMCLAAYAIYWTQGVNAFFRIQFLARGFREYGRGSTGDGTWVFLMLGKDSSIELHPQSFLF
jgi:hypothetical protein